MKKYLLLFVFLLLYTFGYSQSCATSQTVQTSGLCIGCFAANDSNAVDGNSSSYATLTAPVGLLNAEISQFLIFNSTGVAGSEVTVILEDPLGLLNLTVGGNLTIESYMGTTANGDQNSVSSGVLTAISGTNKFISTFYTSASFDRVKVTLSSGLVGIGLTSINVYSACYSDNEFPEVCVSPASSSVNANGSLICLGCKVESPSNAYDGDETTYSELKLGIAVSLFDIPGVSQTLNFSSPSCPGEKVSILFQDPSGAAQINLLGTNTLEFLDGSNTVIGTHTISINNISALSGAGMFRYTTVFNGSYTKLRIKRSGLISALSNLYIHEVCRMASPLPVPAQDTVYVCSGGSALLQANAATGSTVKYYDSETGGTLLSTGNFYTTPALTAETTYYVESEVDSSGCVGAYRQPIVVMVLQQAPAPTLTTKNYTVYPGDGITINPGPTNVTFNFYADRQKNILLGTGTSFQLDSLYVDSTIYVESNLGGCTSQFLDSVQITVTTNIIDDPEPVMGGCADSTTTAGSGLCIACNVVNAPYAVDGNVSTYSELQTTVGLLGADVSQMLYFAQGGTAGDSISVIMEDPVGLLSLTLGGNLVVETYNNGVSNGDAFTVGGSVLSLISGSNKVVMKFPASADFDAVKITLETSLLTADLTKVRIYEVCYEVVTSAYTCMRPVNQSTQVSGALCLLCSVNDGLYAIDNNEFSYSQLNVTLGVAGSASQTFTFSDESCVGEGISLTLENPNGLLSLSLLGDVDLEFLDASDNVLSTHNITMSDLTLISGSQKYSLSVTPTVSFKKVRIRLRGGLVGLLSGLRIYDMCKQVLSSPGVYSDSIMVCEGSTLTLQSFSAMGTTVRWYNDSTGGTLLGIGHLLNTGVLSTDQTFYLETHTASGCISPDRSEISVQVVSVPSPTQITRR